MNNQKISQIIAKKTSLYLKISMSLFVLSLMLLTTAYLFIQQQYIQSKKDFIDNVNTHLISISRVKGEDPTITYPLSFESEKKITEIANNYEDASVFSQYVIPFGMSDKEDNIYFITGVDNRYIKYAGMEEINDNEAIVSNVLDEKDVTLGIPLIKVEDGGFISNERTDLKVSFIPAASSQKPFDEFDVMDNTIIVNTNTYKTMIETMFQVSWSEFQKKQQR